MRLLAQGHQNGTGIGAEAEGGIGVPDLPYGLAGDVRVVGRGAGCDLTGDHNHAGAYQRLAGDAAPLVLFDQSVEDGVADLVSNFVRVADRNGLRSE